MFIPSAFAETDLIWLDRLLARLGLELPPGEELRLEAVELEGLEAPRVDGRQVEVEEALLFEQVDQKRGRASGKPEVLELVAAEKVIDRHGVIDPWGMFFEAVAVVPRFELCH